jgi:sarcosine oxidase subunit beta
VAHHDIIVIGGGNLGCWTAYHLAKRGTGRIALLERGWIGAGHTVRSAGMIRQQGMTALNTQLAIWSRECYLQVGRELGLDSGFNQVGFFVLAATKPEARLYPTLVEQRRALGVDNEWVEPLDGKNRFPPLNWDNLSGATFAATDGYVHPPIVVRNISYAVAKAGVEIHEQCPVTAVEPAANHWRVSTPAGTFEAGQVVCAGGGKGSVELGRFVGLELPVTTHRHQIVVFPFVPRNFPKPFPLFYVPEYGVYMRPEEQGVMLGMNPPGEDDAADAYQIAFDWSYFRETRDRWQTLFPDIEGLPISRVWAAPIDGTPDGQPIIDEPLPGLFVLNAGGYGMMGGPGMGMKMAELVADERITGIDRDLVRLDRFGETDPRLESRAD